MKPAQKTNSRLPDDLRKLLMKTHSISEFKLKGLCDDLDDVAAVWMQADRTIMYRPDQAANAALKCADTFFAKLEKLDGLSLDAMAPLLQRLGLGPVEIDRGDIEELRTSVKRLRTTKRPKPDRAAATIAAADSLLNSWFKHTNHQPTKATTDPTSAYRFYHSVFKHMKVGLPRTLFSPRPGDFAASEIRAFQKAFDGEFERAVRCRPSEISDDELLERRLKRL